ncbi:MAG: ABC transporter permease [Pseudolabrys sp.]|jgi:NitT/TauT family transport system permease protein
MRNLERAMPWLFIATVLILWELAAVAFQVPTFLLPRPSVIAVTLVDKFEPIASNSWDTLVRTMAGFALAVVLGGALGVAIGSSRLIYRGLYPVLIGFNSVPKVAVVPVFVIWFGSGAVPAILTAFLVSFFPISVNVATGLATVEPELLDVLRSLGARKRQILLKVGLPRSLPYFFASLKIAITLAFVGTIISETVAGSRGIGYLMMAATANFDTPLVFAGLIVIAILGIVMYALFAVVEQRMTFWAQRGDGLIT